MMRTPEEMTRNLSRMFYNKLKKFTLPLVNHLGVSQFCYYKITDSGLFVFLSFRPDWEEYCFAEKLYLFDPTIRHPKFCDSGIIDVRAIKDETWWNKVNQVASNKFNINYRLALRNKIANGVEIFAFALNSADPFQHVALMNEIPLLHLFIQRFRDKFSSLQLTLEDNFVDMASLLGPSFYQDTALVPKFVQREQFLKEMGIEIPKLTFRELEIARQLPKGYTASQIGNELFISTRTVEHHLERIKDKFCCSSKSDLIQRVQELESLDCLSF